MLCVGGATSSNLNVLDNKKICNSNKENFKTIKIGAKNLGSFNQQLLGRIHNLYIIISRRTQKGSNLKIIKNDKKIPGGVTGYWRIKKRFSPNTPEHHKTPKYNKTFTIVTQQHT